MLLNEDEQLYEHFAKPLSSIPGETDDEGLVLQIYMQRPRRLHLVHTVWSRIATQVHDTTVQRPGFHLKKLVLLQDQLMNNVCYY